MDRRNGAPSGANIPALKSQATPRTLLLFREARGDSALFSVLDVNRNGGGHTVPHRTDYATAFRALLGRLRTNADAGADVVVEIDGGCDRQGRTLRLFYETGGYTVLSGSGCDVVDRVAYGTAFEQLIAELRRRAGHGSRIEVLIEGGCNVDSKVAA